MSDTRENLKRLFPKGSTVFTILRHRNKTGTVREIGVVSITPSSVTADGKVIPSHPNYDVAEVLDCRLTEKGDAIVVRGSGMDMGVKIATDLSRDLYGESNALRQEWL